MNAALMGIVRKSIDGTSSCEYKKGMNLRQIMIVKIKGYVNAQKQHWKLR